MIDVRTRFNQVVRDTVDTWKSKREVRGVFVYGSYVSGTLTLNSDLDICVVWASEEAPAQLIAEHNGIRVDMTFLTTHDIKRVLEATPRDPFEVAMVVGRLKNALVMYDADGVLKEWQRQASSYKWPEELIRHLRNRAMSSLDKATKYVAREDTVNAVYEIRNALLDIGRVQVMRNGLFEIIRPSEILNEVRMLDPLTYQLFLRTFKLRALDEEGLRMVLEDVKRWLDFAEQEYGKSPYAASAVEILAQAQREYHSAMTHTLNGDYELAVIEMRSAIHSLGQALITLDGVTEMRGGVLVDELRDRHPAFYDQLIVQHGGFEFQPKGIERSINEIRFIAQRL